MHRVLVCKNCHHVEEKHKIKKEYLKDESQLNLKGVKLVNEEYIPCRSHKTNQAWEDCDCDNFVPQKRRQVWEPNP